MSRKQKMPRSGFPHRFGTEESFRDYLAAQRWTDGFAGSKCGHRHGYRLTNSLYQCGSLPPSDLRHSWDSSAS